MHAAACFSGIYYDASLIDAACVNEVFQQACSALNSSFSQNNFIRNMALPHPTVAFISSRQSQYFESCCLQFGNIIEKTGQNIVEELCNSNDTIAKFFKVHSPYFAYYRNFIKSLGYARFDFLLDQSGIVKFIETNSHGGGSFAFISHLTHAIVDNLDLNRAVNQFPKYYDQTYFPRRLLEIEDEMNIDAHDIGLLYSGDSLLFHQDNYQYFELLRLKEQLVNLGRNAVILDARELEADSKTFKYTQSKRISTIFPRVNTTDTAMYKKPEYAAFLNMCANENILSYMPLLALSILQDKSLFAYIHQIKKTGIFSLAEQAFIEQHIPKTIKLAPNSDLSELIENQSEYVLKPANGARGKNVTLGAYMEPDLWRQALLEASQQDFIIQERIKGSSINLGKYKTNCEIAEEQCNRVFSGYYLCNEVLGFMDRITTSPIVNAALGAIIRPVFVSDSLL